MWGCLPACWPAWPPRASWPEAQCSAVSPPPGRWAPGWATPFPPLCLPLQTGSLSGPQTVSSPPEFSPFNTALLGSEALGVSFLPCCKLLPVSLCLRILVQSQIVLDAPPLPGSPTSQQSQEHLECRASLFLPNALSQAMPRTARVPLPALKAQHHSPRMIGEGCWIPGD